MLTRSPRVDDAICLVLACGLISFGFLGYSFGFGAANQHFMMYSAPASALLCTALFFNLTSPDDGDVESTDVTGSPLRRPMAAALVVLLLLLGSLGWTRYYAVEPDDGTVTMAAYVQANVPRCVPINASGSGPRWAAALPDKPVQSYHNGPEAVKNGVALFLLSPKDARYSFGMMTPELSNWITSNGRLLVQTQSRSSELLELWAVGDVTAVPQTATCVKAAAAPTTGAPAGEFLLILAGVLLVVVTAGGAVVLASGRRARK